MLDQSMFAVLTPKKFNPSTTVLYETDVGAMGSKPFISCRQNPTLKELKRDGYKPRLTLTKRRSGQTGFSVYLKIEFSVPKLLYGNNFDELVDSDFQIVITKLLKILRGMGVRVFKHKLVNAPVSTVHYSKNIVLTDYTTPYTYLKQLNKLNINRQLDTNQTDFRNAGHSFKYRANSFEVAFYDKMRDLKKAKGSEKRSEEKDNVVQLNLLDLLEKRDPFEVLRMEVRLNKRQKIRQILKKIDKEMEPTFINLFSQDTAKKVLLHYLNEIEQAYPSLLVHQHNGSGKFFEGLLVANPKLKPARALKLTGLRDVLDDVGVSGYRQITKRYGNYAWYSLNKEMKKLNTSNEKGVFSMLKEEINKFEPLKLLANQDEMLNNVKYG